MFSTIFPAFLGIDFGHLIDSVPPELGYLLVFSLIAVETMGVPVPGETIFILASILAKTNGKMEIEWIIGLAAAAAIIGDNIGFVIGRKVGRKVFTMPGPFLSQRVFALEKGEPFFKKHGSKAVFLGRWVAVLRIASAWLAGINKMHWPTFLFWNALGGIAWALSVGIAAYLAGEAAERAIQKIGVGAAIAIGVIVVGLLIWKIIRHRSQHAELPPTGSEFTASEKPLAEAGNSSVE